MNIRELDAVGQSALATLLPDAPENVIVSHLLRTGGCRAWSALDCVMVESDRFAPGEVHLIGSDLWSIIQLLNGRPDWTAANIVARSAEAIATALAEAGTPVRSIPDIYLTTREAPTIEPRQPARLLRSADATLLDECRPAFAEIDPAFQQALPIAAASFDGERIVSLAAITAGTVRLANISVATLPDWRNRGHVTAAAAILTTAISGTKRIALWSTAETNATSLAIATVLGYTEAARRTYLVKDLAVEG